MLAKRARAAPKPDWHCSHCGAMLSAKTTRDGHEESLSCQAARNRAAAKLRGLTSVNGKSELAARVADALHLPSEAVFDRYRKGAWRPGKKTLTWYVPAWVAELCAGDYHEPSGVTETVGHSTEAEKQLVYKLHIVLLPAVTDLEVRAKLQTVYALAGPRAILAIYEYAEKAVDHAATG